MFICETFGHLFLKMNEMVTEKILNKNYWKIKNVFYEV